MRSQLILVLATATLAAACGGENADAPEAAQEPTMSSSDETTTAPDAPELLGAWTLEYVEDRPVIDRSPAYIEFDAEGRVSGQASCNRMTGSYTADSVSLTFSPLAVTRMMCPEALMEQEQRVLAALEKVTSWRIEEGMLMLEDEDGGQVFRASPRGEAP